MYSRQSSGHGARGRQQFGRPASAATIHDGLSVQELKVMTAMRMAQNGEGSQLHSHGLLSQNPASTYETATPQQLRAAGIQPVVMPSNNLNQLSSNHPATFSANLATPTNSNTNNSHNGHANGLNRQQILLQQQQQLQLQQQQQRLRSELADVPLQSDFSLSRYGGSNNSVPTRAMELRRAQQSRQSQPELTGQQHALLLRQQQQQAVREARSLWNSNMLSADEEIVIPRRNFLDSERFQDMRPNSKELRERATLAQLQQQQQMLLSRDFDRERGPEVRTPEWNEGRNRSAARHNALPVLDMSPQKPSDSLVFGGYRSLGGDAVGNGFNGFNSLANSNSSTNTLALKPKLLKSQTQPTLKSEDLPYLSTNSIAGFAAMSALQNEVEFREQAYDGPALSAEHIFSDNIPSNGTTPKFPLMKSKTASRLLDSPVSFSPVASTKHALPGKPVRDSPLLANEMAESVLNLSSPFAQNGFFADVDFADGRYSWDAGSSTELQGSDAARNSSNNNHSDSHDSNDEKSSNSSLEGYDADFSRHVSGPLSVLALE